MANLNPVLIGLTAGVFIWVAMFTVISYVGGWNTLAGQYRSQETYSGPSWSFQKGQMRWLVGYNNCLTVGADQRGLFLSSLFLFRIAHPPLFIPWRDISYVYKKFLWTRYVELRLGRDLNIPLRINLQLAEKLKAAAGASWPIEAVA